MTEMNEMKEKLAQLNHLLGGLAENAYVEMIAAQRRDEALGWEAKVDHGEFGQAELDAHKKAAEWLGRHRGLRRAQQAIDDLAKAWRLDEV